MKRNVWIGGLAAIVLSYGGLVAAQTAGSATSDQKSSGSTVTVSGCLASADEAAGATGTTGSTATPPSSTTTSEKFVLKNAKSGSSAPSSATTTSTPPSTTGTSGSTYMLEGKSSDLKMHVGHQVEITGKIAGDSSTSRSSTSTSAAGATSASASAMSGPKLEVESVRMIASTCSSR